MYIVLTFTALILFVLLTMFAAFLIVAYFTRKKMTTKTKEEKIWERLKENQEDISKNSSQ
jgi:hypothetical protein